MEQINTILIRLPNWLGDMVMGTAFVNAVRAEFPAAIIDLIIKKDLKSLARNLPAHDKDYFFSKKEYKGVKGAKLFGKEIRKEKRYDLFICLPESFSSAVMGKAIRAKKSIGFRKGMNFLLLDKTYKRKKHAHRVEEYIDLLSQFLKKEIAVSPVCLSAAIILKNDSLIVNINSEASSRRLPKEKAVSIINNLRQNILNEIVLIGGPKEKAHVDEVYSMLVDKTGIKNIAGQTSLPELADIFASAKGTLTTDSGPAHVSNAAGTNTVVLFGAGDENNTAPYNSNNRTIIRLGKLSCEPCKDNMCKRYGSPECLLQLDEDVITAAVVKILSV